MNIDHVRKESEKENKCSYVTILSEVTVSSAEGGQVFGFSTSWCSLLPLLTRSLNNSC